MHIPYGFSSRSDRQYIAANSNRCSVENEIRLAAEHNGNLAFVEESFKNRFCLGGD